jgi:hypothetical protein
VSITSELAHGLRHNWTGNHVGGDEFAGLCPLHPDTQPSFYINARKNLFYWESALQSLQPQGWLDSTARSTSRDADGSPATCHLSSRNLP